MKSSAARSAARQVPARIASQIARAQELNARLNAFTHLYSAQDVAEQAARASQGGVLEGVTVGVKDLFATADEAPTSCASETLREYRSPFDATVVQKLRRAGAVLTGKTNMDEFGMGSANVHSDFGPVTNPAGPSGVTASLSLPEKERRVAGGSSGGSAAAVASGLCDVALASDTGGSTRLPASYCGVYGFKPSYGVLSRYGMIAYASSLDTVGLVSRDAALLETTFTALEGFDPRDPTSIPTAPRQRSRTANAEMLSRLSAADAERPLEGVRIGVPADLIPQSTLDSPSLLAPFRSFLASLRSLGATLTSVRLPSAPLGLSAYYVLASAEASSNLARYDGVQYGFRAPEGTAEEGAVGKGALYAKTRSAGFGKEVKKRILLGTFALSADAFDNYYLQAQRVRRMVQLELDGVFRLANPLSTSQASETTANTRSQGVDFLVHPSALSTAPLLSSAPRATPSSTSAFSSTTASTADSTSRNAYLQDLLTVPASLAGLPALSLPAGRDAKDGWPVGVTLMGQWGSDRAVLEVAKRWEELRKREGQWEDLRD
ncbi:hypothetical protein JCM10908_003277 [Rhodotorula pacifica]|uniref:uncharacterized protein n=1 Tax=Rhodotorula pacifica TaxID=1495444 RepID=UPI003181031A